MRTFHTGGVQTGSAVENEILSSVAGTVAYRELNVAEVTFGSRKALVALKRNGELAVLDDKNREVDRYRVPYGAMVLVAEGTKVKPGMRLVTWDPHRVPILAEAAGSVRFQEHRGRRDGPCRGRAHQGPGVGDRAWWSSSTRARSTRESSSRTRTERSWTSTTCRPRPASRWKRARR